MEAKIIVSLSPFPLLPFIPGEEDEEGEGKGSETGARTGR
jgi:hypothetical protein